MKKVINVLFLALLFLSAQLFPGRLPVLAPGPAPAGSLANSYDQLAQRFPNYISQLKDNGATEDQIRAFVKDLDALLQGQTLTEENFNSAMLSAALQLSLKDEHHDVVEAIRKGFANDLPELLQGKIPASLQPLYDVLKEKLLARPPQEPPSSGGSGGSGGGSLPAPAGVSKEITAAAGGSLSFAGVTVEVPARALPASATISIKKLTADEVNSVVPPALRLKLASDVFDLDTTGSRSFSTEITLRLAFDPAKIAAGEQAAAFYFDGTDWVKLGGTVEGSAVVVRLNHLTRFAVFSTRAEPPAVPAPPAAPAPPPVKTFADLAGHWAKQDIEAMLAKGLVAGVSATEFAPDRTVTRAEFTALLVRALGIQYAPGLRSSFADVPGDAWYAAVVTAAAQNGLVGGYSATGFGPEDPITREQMAAMVVHAFNYAGKGVTLTDAEVSAQLARFTDAPAISPWARASVAGAVTKGIVKGRTATAIVPQGTATRAEAAVMILRMHGQIQSGR